MSLQARFRKPKQQPQPVLVKPNGNGNGESLLLSLKQTAVYIGLPLRQIRSLVTAGILKTVPTKTKAFYVARAECDRYVQSLISATAQQLASQPQIAIDRPLKKKKSWKPLISKQPKFPTMTDAEVQDFFRTVVIDDEGNIVALNEED